MFTRSLVRRALVGVGLVVLGAAGSVHGQDTLKYKWNKGDVHHYRSTQDSVAKMTVMGMTQTTTQHQEWVQRFEVKDVAADGVATLDLTVLSVKITQEQDTGAKASFDSTQPAEKQFDGAPKLKPQMEALSAMVGEHITVTIDGVGAIKKVEGMSKVVEKMQVKIGNVNPMVSRNLAAMMGDESMRGNLERYFKVLPDKAVKSGDSWNNSFEQSIPGAGSRMKVDSAWTLAGVEAAGAKMTSKMKFEVVVPKEGEPKGAGPEMKTTMTDGKGDAEVLFDAKAGQLVKSVVNMTLPIESTMAGQQGGQSVSIKNDTTQKISFERIPAPEKSEDTTKPAGS